MASHLVIMDDAKNIVLDIQCDELGTKLVVDEGGPNEMIINPGTLRMHGLHAVQAHELANDNQTAIAALTARVAALEALHED